MKIGDRVYSIIKQFEKEVGVVISVNSNRVYPTDTRRRIYLVEFNVKHPDGHSGNGIG